MQTIQQTTMIVLIGSSISMNDKQIQGMMSSEHQDWATPPPFMRYLEEVFGWVPDLDAAASKENTKAPLYYDIEDNGLFGEWRGNVWVNPPFGSALPSWIDKAIIESDRDEVESIFMLIPARTDTQWCHKLMKHASIIYFIKGRFDFRRFPELEREGCAFFPSMLVVFNGDERILAEMLPLNVPIESRRWDK